MKKLFLFATLYAFLFTGIVSCDSNDDFTKEEYAYFEQNKQYITEKMAEKDEAGNPLYQQITEEDVTMLYRVLEGEPEGDNPKIDTDVTFRLTGKLINDVVFQPEAKMTYQPRKLIAGVALALLHSYKGQTIEAIIPAEWGYGYINDLGQIPKGSTLIFTYTVLDVAE